MNFFKMWVIMSISLLSCIGILIGLVSLATLFMPWGPYVVGFLVLTAFLSFMANSW